MLWMGDSRDCRKTPQFHTLFPPPPMTIDCFSVLLSINDDDHGRRVFMNKYFAFYCSYLHTQFDRNIQSRSSIDLHRSSNKRSLYTERQFLRLQPLSLLVVMYPSVIAASTSCSVLLSISASSCCIQQLNTPTYLSAKAVQWQLHSARAHVPILIQCCSALVGSSVRLLGTYYTCYGTILSVNCWLFAGLVCSSRCLVHNCLQPQPAAATAIVCAVITWGQTQISIRNYKLYCM